MNNGCGTIIKMIILRKKFLNKKYKGVTSILVVIAVTVVLTIIISGIAALTVREIRQASNTELSSRALQTAESGVKAAVQKLNSDPTYQTPGSSSEPAECGPDGAVFNNVVGDNQTITCAVVKSNFSGVYESYLDKDKATQLFLGNAYNASSATVDNTPRYLKISWDDSNFDKNNNPGATLNYTGSLYPLVEGYVYPASMEIGVVYWPASGLGTLASGESNAKVATIFLVPGKADEGYSKSRSQVKNVCSEVSGYRCSTENQANQKGFNLAGALGINENDMANYKFSVRVKPRYANTHFKIESYNASGNNTNIFSSKSQIDVTAKVGNLYRRVKAEKVTFPVALENVFDSVIFSGNNVIGDTTNSSICKNIVTKKDSAGVYKKIENNPGAVQCN